MTDEELIEQYKNGQVSALEQLVKKYERQLFSFILNMMERRGDADEVFQEVWFRVIKKITSYKHKNFFGWIVRIAHNIVIDKARKKKPDVSLDAETEQGVAIAEKIPDTIISPDAQFEDQDLGQHIASAVNKLPVEQKEVFLLRSQADLSFKEIAGVQGVSINTVLARMQYALSKLRPLLRGQYEAVTAGG